MKKIVLIAAAAGLMSLAACNKPADTTTNNVADQAAVIDNTAGAMEDTSNATANEAVANAMDSAAEVGNVTTNAQ